MLTADTSTTYTVSDNSSTDALFAALQAHPSAVPFGIQAIRSGMIAPDGQTAYFCTERNVHCLNISRNSTSLARQISGSARWDYQSLTLSQDGRWLLAVSFGRLHNGGVIEGPDPDNAYDSVVIISTQLRRVVDIRYMWFPGFDGPVTITNDGQHAVLLSRHGVLHIIDLQPIARKAGLEAQPDP